MSPWSWFYSDINLDTNVTDLEGLEFSLSSSIVAIGARMIAYAGQETTPGRVLRGAAQRAQQLICRARTRVSAALLLPSHAHKHNTKTHIHTTHTHIP